MTIDQTLLDHLAAFDTPTICNALEVVYGARVTTGFTTRPFVCAFPDMKPIVGFARTATMRAIQGPRLKGAEAKEHRLAYYAYVAGEKEPTIAVIQDLDPNPGIGAMWGEVNTAVHRGLGCLGCITNGSIRDLDAVDPRFQLLAGMLGPSHADVHVESFEVPVNIHGMPVDHGDLIHADRHGAVVIPRDRAAEVPAAIDLCVRREEPILKAARAEGFNVQKLREAMGTAADIH
ncbi:MAG: RraA family protein [Geminicoccaceae bacterium]|nr:RraA family protein [Geminicoccaceae bacterium]